MGSLIALALLLWAEIASAQGLGSTGVRFGPGGAVSFKALAPSAIVYNILELGSNDAPTAWNSPAFDTANVIPLLGFDNTSSFSCTAKVIWQNAATDRGFLSVSCTDTDDEVPALANDASTWFSTGHDNIDFRWRADTTRVFDTNAYMVSANLQPVFFDADWSGADNTRNTAVNLNTTVASVINAGSNWKIFAAFDLGSDIVPGTNGLCNLAIRDKDAASAVTVKHFQGTTANSLLAINEYALCRFATETLPDPPPDTTSPVVNNTGESNLTSTSVRITANTSEEGICRVRYGTSSGSYPQTSGNVSSTDGLCVIDLSGLSSGTTYFYVVDVTDPSNNGGTSSEDSFTTPAPSTFYVSTSGSGTTCSNALPCAVSRLTATTEPKPSPGETWLVKDGTYNQNTTFDCAAGVSNGTASQPITIKAENERQAFFRGTGTAAAMSLLNCSYWIVDGLRVENQDNGASTLSANGVLRLSSSNNNIIKNGLFRNPNRHGNTTGIGLVASINNLIVDNELLYFHRNGINESTTANSGNILRRNYLNPQGAKSDAPYFGHPNDCFVIYNWSDTIVENNIAEGCEQNFASFGPRAKFYGNISLNATGNGFAIAHGVLEGSGRQALDNELYNNVSIGHSGNAVYCRTVLGATGCKVENFTAIGGANGLGADNGYDVRRGCAADAGCLHTHTPNLEIRNALAIDSSSSRFYVNHNTEFGSIEIDYSHGWPSSGAWGSGTSGRTNSPPTDPGNVDPGATFDTCPVFVASSSPMKGKGSAGADIGANVLYAYINGALNTAQKLWNSSTDAWNFTRATISGVNSTNALSTLHQRLHPSCNWAGSPAGY